MFKNIIGKIKYTFKYWGFKYFGIRYKFKYKTGDKTLNILPGDFDGDPISIMAIRKKALLRWIKKER